MKITEILISYLQSRKRLALPGLGVFTLSDVAVAIPDKDTPPGFPPGSVTFAWNTATPEDPALIAEISAITGKIKPLASSDLEALVIQGKQLINISKPFTIDGLGSIQRTNKGDMEFLPAVQAEDSQRADKKFDEAGESIRFDENYLKPSNRRPAGSRNLTVASLVFIGLLVLGWVGYFVYQHSAKTDKPTLIMEREPMAIQDTTPRRMVQDQTQDEQSVSTQSPDSLVTQASPEINRASLDRNVSSVSSTTVAAELQQNTIAKTDSVAKPVARKPRKKNTTSPADSNAANITIPIKIPEVEMTAPVDTVNHQ